MVFNLDLLVLTDFSWILQLLFFKSFATPPTNCVMLIQIPSIGFEWLPFTCQLLLYISVVSLRVGGHCYAVATKKMEPGSPSMSGPPRVGVVKNKWGYGNECFRSVITNIKYLLKK